MDDDDRKVIADLGFTEADFARFTKAREGVGTRIVEHGVPPLPTELSDVECISVIMAASIVLALRFHATPYAILAVLTADSPRTPSANGT